MCYAPADKSPGPINYIIPGNGPPPLFGHLQRVSEICSTRRVAIGLLFGSEIEFNQSCKSREKEKLQAREPTVAALKRCKLLSFATPRVEYQFYLQPLAATAGSMTLIIIAISHFVSSQRPLQPQPSGEAAPTPTSRGRKTPQGRQKCREYAAMYGEDTAQSA